MTLHPALKAGQSITLLSPEQSSAVMAHPAQQANIQHVKELISRLRSCESPEDYFDFQRVLFGRLYQVEAARGEATRVLKRLRKGRGLPEKVPRLPAGADAQAPGTWEFEAFVYERLARQLRVVGDGLAWRCFGYDRRMILVLSSNASPGPMYGKTGLEYELGRVTELWQEHRHFALLHDLTNCLRIADITEFAGDGKCWLREIKKTPRTERSQMDRTQAAVDALMSGGPLPGRPNALLLEVDEPYDTNIPQLADIIALSRRHGCRAMKLLPGRALLASSLIAAAIRWGNDYEAMGRAIDSTRQRAFKRAGIANAMHHLRGVSGDTAARSPTMAPWAIYPFSEEECAALICDLLIFETTLAVEALQESLAKVGLRSEVLLLPQNGPMAADQDVLRVYGPNGRALTVHQGSLNLLLYELVKLDTWARGIKEVLDKSTVTGEPVVVFAGESDTWV